MKHLCILLLLCFILSASARPVIRNEAEPQTWSPSELNPSTTEPTSESTSTLTPSHNVDARGPNDALSCSYDWQCVSVSNSYNYVKCISGKCTCLTEQGFVGNATTGNKCKCPSSRGQLHWDGALPYCLDYDTCVDNQNAFDRTEILKAQIHRLYDLLLPPYPPLIMSGQLVVTDLFSASTKGRIDPLGTYDDFASLVEYFYAFAANPSNYVSAVHFVDLFGATNEVFVRVDITFSWLDTSLGLAPFNLTESGRFLFDENNLIISTDLIAHNVGKASASIGIPTDTYKQQTCGLLTVSPATCPQSLDPDGYYTDFVDCLTFMNSIPEGSLDRASSNSFWCRFVHSLLTIYDPVRHCSHAGKTGGGKCIDKPYSDYYLHQY